MEESVNKKQGGKNVSGIKTFPIEWDLGNTKESNNINTPSQYSKKQLINQAFNYHLKGDISKASKYYQILINQGFKHHSVFSNYGLILKELGKLKEAEKYIRKAIELKPDFAEAYSNLGNIFKDLGKLQEAELLQRKAIELKPDFAAAHSNLGSVLKDLDNLKGAELSQRKAIELKPDFAEAHSNLGSVLKDLGELKEAESSHRKAIELEPNKADAYFNLSIIELLNGDYENGLENYEFRFKKKKPATLNGNPIISKIDNLKFQKEENILVISEQGLGDTLQYMRYIPYLRSKGINVSFCAQTKLHSLIKVSGIDLNPLTPEQSTLVSKGKWIPLLSLPRCLKVKPEKPIITEPYIFSTKELKQKWGKILSKEKRPIIGINWQGSQEMERSSYQGRSFPLEKFSLVAKIHGVTMLSLQKGFGSEQLNNCSFKNKFIQCQKQVDNTWDFLENAAIIDSCDLIITCDTSMAHLAGGMGKKVWLLLRDIPFWTWGLKEKSTFWYPSIRLFRQKERHNWDELMLRVSKALKEEIETES